MPNPPVTWDRPDDELEELVGPDTDLMEDDPDQAPQTDFFWEDDEE